MTAPRFRPSSRTLFRLLVGSSVLGVVLPLVTFLLKPAAEDFHLWRNWRDAEPERAAFFRDNPVLDLEQTLPFLADLSWHSPRETQFLGVYGPHVVLNALVLVGLVLFRRRLLACLQPCSTWLSAPTDRRPRLLAFAFTAGVIFCYQTQSSLGFYFPGIGGWTYRDWRATLRPELEPDPAGGEAPSTEERAFLEQALAPENARYLPGPGYLTGKAMFLHYAGGEALPASYELIGMVFPHYYFGGKHQRVTDPETFGAMLRHSLASWRRTGGRFLLPNSIAYPNHSVYSPIDYSGYPDPETLEEVSFWRLSLRIDDELQVELVTAVEDLRVGV